MVPGYIAKAIYSLRPGLLICTGEASLLCLSDPHSDAGSLMQDLRGDDDLEDETSSDAMHDSYASGAPGTSSHIPPVQPGSTSFHTHRMIPSLLTSSGCTSSHLSVRKVAGDIHGVDASANPVRKARETVSRAKDSVNGDVCMGEGEQSDGGKHKVKHCDDANAEPKLRRIGCTHADAGEVWVNGFMVGTGDKRTVCLCTVNKLSRCELMPCSHMHGRAA
jgi:hypothetical protein